MGRGSFAFIEESVLQDTRGHITKGLRARMVDDKERLEIECMSIDVREEEIFISISTSHLLDVNDCCTIVSDCMCINRHTLTVLPQADNSLIVISLGMHEMTRLYMSKARTVRTIVTLSLLSVIFVLLMLFGHDILLL